MAVRDDAGRPLPGLGADDCRPIRADSLRAPVLWGSATETAGKLTALAGKTVRLEFHLTDASLYAFDFSP